MAAPKLDIGRSPQHPLFFILDPHKGYMQRKSILFAGLLNFLNKPLFEVGQSTIMMVHLGLAESDIKSLGFLKKHQKYPKQTDLGAVQNYLHFPLMG